jgi:hypothetical protein
MEAKDCSHTEGRNFPDSCWNPCCFGRSLIRWTSVFATCKYCGQNGKQIHIGSSYINAYNSSRGQFVRAMDTVRGFMQEWRKSLTTSPITRTQKIIIWEAHSDSYECCHLLGYSVVWPVCERTFRRNASPPSSGCLASYCTLVSCSANIRPWRWRWYVPLKRRLIYAVHGSIAQKMAIFTRWTCHYVQIINYHVMRTCEDVSPSLCHS